jgi:two-component system response regulator DevR
MSIKVLLADDSALVRRAIRQLLSDEPQIALIGEATDFAQTIQMIHELQPHLVVLDLHMSDGRRISPPEFKTRVNSASTRVLAISVWNDDESQALAESFGAAKLLDKVNLGTHLIPAIFQLASASSELPSSELQ